MWLIFCLAWNFLGKAKANNCVILVRKQLFIIVIMVENVIIDFFCGEWYIEKSIMLISDSSDLCFFDGLKPPW